MAKSKPEVKEGDEDFLDDPQFWQEVDDDILEWLYQEQGTKDGNES